MTDRIYGKPIDVAKFKQPVLIDIRRHLEKTESIIDYLAKNEKIINQDFCYICESNERTILTEIHGFTYVTCSDCGHVYTSQRYMDAAIRRFYETNVYWAETTYANKATCFYRREHVALPKVQFVERYSSKSKGSWLDIGSGIGDMVSVACERGWQAVGLELSRTSISFARDVFDVNLLPLTLKEFVSLHPSSVGSFSVVSLIGVLEHVTDPMELLLDTKRMLNSEGIVIIQVPNSNSLATMTQEVFTENVFRHMSPIEHIMVFSERSLNKSLENAGFEPLAYWYHGLDFYELLTNLVLINPRVRDSRLYNIIMEKLNYFQQVIDDNELSDRIICVAKCRN